MKVIRGYKTELDLTNKQQTACLKHAGVSRFAYNWGLARSQEIYRITGKRPTAIQLHRELNVLKQTDYPWMYEVSKCAPQEALRDLEQAYKHFFRQLVLKKAGQFKGKLGFPKFKKKSNSIGSFRFNEGKYIHIYKNAIQLPRLGRLRLHENDYLPTDAKILSATVSERAGRWFISVQVEEEQEKLAPTVASVIGVDLGIKTLATLSNGTIFENPRALKHAQKKLRRLERQKSRRTKGSKNRTKTQRVIAKVHARIANIRKDAAHKLTTYLAKHHALIAIEDLHVSGMLKNHKLAQAVSDSNFGEIRRQLEYKTKWQNVHLVTVDRFYPSSKTCSGCGYVKPELSLGERIFICEACGLIIERDLNASINLKNVAVSSIDTQNTYGQDRSGSVAIQSETGLIEVRTKQHYGLSINV